MNTRELASKLDDVVDQVRGLAAEHNAKVDEALELLRALAHAQGP